MKTVRHCACDECKAKVALCFSAPLTVLDMFDYVFPENGLMAFRDGKLFSQMVR